MVRDDHLTLLRAANTRFFDDGGRDIGLVIDRKRPYGDTTCFELDMASILGVKPEQGDELSEAQMAQLDAVHEEMQPVLQVFLRQAALAPGPVRTGLLPTHGTSAPRGVVDRELPHRRIRRRVAPVYGAAPMPLTSGA